MAFESKGFIYGSLIARMLGIGFIMLCKAGKSPGITMKTCYSTEYSYDCLEVQRELLSDQDRYLLVDDCLATGGTLCAGVELLNSIGKVKAAFVLFKDDKYWAEARKKLEPCKVIYLFSK